MQCEDLWQEEREGRLSGEAPRGAPGKRRGGSGRRDVLVAVGQEKELEKELEKGTEKEREKEKEREREREIRMET